MSNFRMDNPTDRWMAFLSEPEKLINMAKFDISVYPNLMKAVELLDRSNYSVSQQIAYDNHLFAVADINQSRIESFDKGFEEGMEKGMGKGIDKGRMMGIEEGMNKTIAILQELRDGTKSNEEIAEQYQVNLKEVIGLSKL